MRRILLAGDHAFWQLPVAFRYSWVGVIWLFSILTGSSTNPRDFRNIKQLRRERLERHARPR